MGWDRMVQDGMNVFIVAEFPSCKILPGIIITIGSASFLISTKVVWGALPAMQLWTKIPCL